MKFIIAHGVSGLDRDAECTNCGEVNGKKDLSKPKWLAIYSLLVRR